MSILRRLFGDGLHESKAKRKEIVEKPRTFKDVRNEYFDYCVDDFINKNYNGVVRWVYDDAYKGKDLLNARYIEVIIYRANGMGKRVTITVDTILSSYRFTRDDKDDIKKKYSIQSCISLIEDMLKIDCGKCTFTPHDFLEGDEITALIDELMERGYQVIKDKEDIYVFNV